MVKCSLIHRLLQLSVAECVSLALIVMALVHIFGYYGEYNYTHVPRDQIHKVLYRETVPHIQKRDIDCTYDEVLNNEDIINVADIPKKYDDFDPTGIVNGSYMPPCKPAFSVAVLVTYRNRQKQLDVFLPYMHNFLRKQNIHYKIYLIEQRDENPWNKGTLYNLGAKRAIADKFPCLILHDVDLLPLSRGALYACTSHPRHLSAAIDKFRYVLPYTTLVGGVTAITADHYVAVNGFSNMFLKWGGEDDDFVQRIEKHGLTVMRFPSGMSRYTMLVHQQEAKNPNRMRVLADSRRAADGLATTHYRAIEVRQHRLFTLIGVHL